MTLNAKHRAKHAENLFKLFKDQDLCDVTCIIGEKKEEIGVHGVLLAAISPVFKGILCECEKTNQPKILEIQDINPAAFNCVLEFAYRNRPTLTRDIIPLVKDICNKYEIPSLSEECDDYSQSYLPKLIKTIRQKKIKKYKDNEAFKAQWRDIVKTKNFGRYKNSEIGSFAVHHMLDSSDDIRKEMGDIIPKCDLKFTSNPNMSNYKSLYKVKLSDTFEHPSQMQQLIDDRLYNSQICFEFNGISNIFWCKSFGRSALDRAMGASVSDYIARYGPQRVLHLLNDTFRVKLSGKNIGVAFCNLFETKKKIVGHQMIQFDQDSMLNDEIEFFVSNNLVVRQLKMTLVSNKLKKNNPLVLCEYNMPTTQQTEFKSNVYNQNQLQHQPQQQPLFPQNIPLNNGYERSRGPSQVVMSIRNDPLRYNSHGITNNNPIPTSSHANNNQNIQFNNFIGNHMNGNDTIDMDPSILDNASVSSFPGQFAANPFNQSTSTFAANPF